MRREDQRLERRGFVVDRFVLTGFFFVLLTAA